MRLICTYHHNHSFRVIDALNGIVMYIHQVQQIQPVWDSHIIIRIVISIGHRSSVPHREQR